MKNKISLAIRNLTLAVAGLAAASQAGAIELPEFITDSMVVQNNSTLRICGKGAGKVSVDPSWTSAPIAAKTQNGNFSVEIPTPEVGGPYCITFTDDNGRTTLTNIYSGEVWLCSGQSNMEMPVGGWGKVASYQEEIAAAHYPMVRLLQIAKTTAPTQQSNVPVNMGGWRSATPETVENFSSIGYFFGRDLSAQLGGVPVGIIDCTWGGTPAEAWSSLGGVASVPGFEDEVLTLTQANGDAARMQQINDSIQAAWLSIAKADEVQINPAALSYSGTTIALPQYIETAAGRSLDGIFWLQREVNIPASMAGKDLSLNLSKIDDEDVTYFNGTIVGRMSGYDTPRHYTIPASLAKEGKALISIKVTDFSGEGGLWSSNTPLNITDGTTTIPLAGDWTFTLAVDFGKLPPRPQPLGSSSYPTVLYNAMFAPLKDFPVKGVLWYQGCANVGRDRQYSPLFKRMIADWRQLRNQPDMPFYFMQLAGFLQPQALQPESEWAALRQAQADARELPGVYMASAIDIGNPNDIHPKNKQEAARRFLNLALHNSYGKDVVCEAPEPVACKRSGKGIDITFGGNVTTDSGAAPQGFIVLLDNGKWQRAKASLKGNSTIHLSADGGKIKEVRYNWADYPDGNLRGESGLPVVPFKKDIQ